MRDIVHQSSHPTERRIAPIVTKIGLAYLPPTLRTHQPGLTAPPSPLQPSRSDKSSTFTVRSVDVVKFFVEHLSPWDFNVLKLDVEGAEYEILRVLMSTGLGCWLKEVYLEYHATHNEAHYNKRPLDVVSAFSDINHTSIAPLAVPWSSLFGTVLYYSHHRFVS